MIVKWGIMIAIWAVMSILEWMIKTGLNQPIRASQIQRSSRRDLRNEKSEMEDKLGDQEQYGDCNSPSVQGSSIRRMHYWPK
mmetsp:Transcript_2913/g.5383  ORF Transcript_2913/g.5383 Transcript_2913/m.5383 type:complete len:82 (+) Transcript_2913:459-704(+)